MYAFAHKIEGNANAGLAEMLCPPSKPAFNITISAFKSELVLVFALVLVPVLVGV